MNHSQKAHDFINQITDIIAKFQWEFNNYDVRKQMCYELNYLFDTKFDEYWQKMSGLYPQDITFIDMTADKMEGYQIGISIKNSEPIMLSVFITEHFGIKAVRDRKIKDIIS